MHTGHCPEVEVVKDAERILYREKWRVCEERAAQRLAHGPSLTFTRLFPDSAVIHVVAVDGVVVGQVRRNGTRWISIAKGQHAPVATRRTMHAAIKALVSAVMAC